MMSFAREFSLQPELVSDVIEELIDADIISQTNIKNLKGDFNNSLTDPNKIMDARHEEIKRKYHHNKQLENKEFMIRLNRADKSNTHKPLNYLQVDKEIEKFRKELDVERRKLYELTRLSNDYKRNTGNNNLIINQPVPVTNVVTQRKIKNTEISKKEDKVELQLCRAENQLVLKEKPIEICGSKPSSLTVPLKKPCINEESPFCPHKRSTKDVENVTQSGVQTSYIAKKGKDSLMKNNKETKFGGNVIGNNQKSQTLATKTVMKWKSFVTDRKTNQFNKEERLLRIKKRKYILQKYWNEWKTYCKNSRKIKEELIKHKVRTEKMNQFFEKLEEQKKNLEEIPTNAVINVNNVKNKTKTDQNQHIVKGSIFTNRLSAQKAIIKEQKDRLKEKDKIIQQLQEEKLKGDIQRISGNIHLTIQETIQNFDLRLRPQVKQLANKANIYIDNSFKIHECSFVKRMNERAQERKEKREMIMLKKQLSEEDKKRKLMEDEDKKQFAEEELKRNKIRKQKEKVRLERELELKRLMQIEELRLKMREAEKFYHENLMRRTLNAFRTNVLSIKRLEHECEEHYNEKLLRKSIRNWKKVTDIIIQRNIAVANAFYIFNLMSKCWNKWILLYSEAVQKRQVAEDFYDSKLQEKAFIIWKTYVNKQYFENERKLEFARCYYNRQLKKRYFKNWKRLPVVMYEIREEEKKIREWREKILEIIPDFKPEIVYEGDDFSE